MTEQITQEQGEKALAIVAAWMGRQGYGTPSCPDGRTLDAYAFHADDNTPCRNCTFGPAPTGRDAAHKGLGPMLVMDWDWPGKPTPTLLLEGGPDDWAIEFGGTHENFDAMTAIGVFAEPYAGYALCLYPAWSDAEAAR